MLKSAEKTMIEATDDKATAKAVRYVLEQLNILEPTAKKLGQLDSYYKLVGEIKADVGSIDEINRHYNSHMEAVRTTVDRAEDIWAIDFAHSTEGYLPAGNQIGRRPLCPEDFGLSSWDMRIQGKSFSPVRCVTNEDMFAVITGFAYKPIDDDTLRGIRQIPAGVWLPYSPRSRKWKSIDGWYIRNLPECYVVAPKSLYELVCYQTKDNTYTDCCIEILGEAIGKRSYLIKEPSDILSDHIIRQQNRNR